jgi:hypothetical protein
MGVAWVSGLSSNIISIFAHFDSLPNKDKGALNYTIWKTNRDYLSLNLLLILDSLPC